MKGPLIQLYPFFGSFNIPECAYLKYNFFSISQKWYTLLWLVTFYPSDCQMQNAIPSLLMCIFMGMWCVCVSEHACCSLKLISNVFLDHSLPPLLRQGLPQKLKPTSSDNFRKPACTGDALSLCLYRAGSQEAIISAWHFLGLWGSKFWSPHTCTGSTSSTEPSPRPQTGPI